MKNLLIITMAILMVILMSGCSIHQFWNGSKKPGLTYITVDSQGNTNSNAKAIAYAEDFYANLIKQKAESGNSGENNKELIDKLVQELKDLSKRNTLFIWGADYNGAMINEKGNMCLQAASYARSADTTLDISASLLNLINGINLTDPKDKLLALKITETITSLQANSQQSTYLSAGLFGICILQANGALEEGESAKAVSELINASQLKISVDREDDNSEKDATEDSIKKEKIKNQKK